MSISEGKTIWLKLNGTKVSCDRDLVPFGVIWCKENLQKGDWAVQNGTIRQKSYFYFKYDSDAQDFEIEVI